MRIKIDRRLQTVLSLIEGEECLCDVGTDHGKLPVAALLTGRAKRAVAIDISEKSLSKARLLAEQEGVEMRCIVGDGLSALQEGEASVVVIAGMGGAEIVKILGAAPCVFPRYIFVPHKNAPLLRAYLREKKAGILRDVAVKEGKHYYFVIEASFDAEWREHSLYFGTEGEDFEAYRNARLKKIEELLRVTKDPALREEKEELTNAHIARDHRGA